MKTKQDESDSLKTEQELLERELRRSERQAVWTERAELVFGLFLILIGCTALLVVTLIPLFAIAYALSAGWHAGS